jgi:hypothetical protein
MLAKNLHVWENLCWMLKILQLQYHQPRVLTIPMMSISRKRVFFVHSYHYKSSCVKVNCGWWMAMARSVEFVWFNLDMGASLSSNSHIWWADIQMGLALFWPNCKPLHPREKIEPELLRNQSIGYSALITIPIIKLYTLTTLHKCQALVLWWRPKAHHRFSKMCVPTPKLDHAHC